MKTPINVKIYSHALKSQRQTVYSFLKQVYGLNRSRIYFLCGLNMINPLSHVQQVNIERFNNFKRLIERHFLVDAKLKKKNSNHIRSLLKSGDFKARRILSGLPARGQSGRANGKTARRLANRISIPGLPRYGVLSSKRNLPKIPIVRK